MSPALNLLLSSSLHLQVRPPVSPFWSPQEIHKSSQRVDDAEGSDMLLPVTHLAVGVRIQQGRLHVDRGPGGVEDHVVHVLLHHLRVSWVLGPLNPLQTGARLSGNQTFDSFQNILRVESSR